AHASLPVGVPCASRAPSTARADARPLVASASSDNEWLSPCPPEGKQGLESLWRDLGIEHGSDGITLSASGPLSQLRQRVSLGGGAHVKFAWGNRSIVRHSDGR